MLVSSLLNLHMVLFACVKVEEHSAMQGCEGLFRIYRAGKHMPPLGEGAPGKQRPLWRGRHRPLVIF